MDNHNIGIIGGGSIGVAFAVVFARAGARVQIYEPAVSRREQVLDDVIGRLQILERYKLLDETPQLIASRIYMADSFPEAVKNADLVQECIPEQLELKKNLFMDLAEIISNECVVASSTSFIPTSLSSQGSGIEDRTLVAHPGNPPYAIPVIELVPHALTSSKILDRAERIYLRAGMSPVRVRKEIEGFVFNRLQGAILREAYALVRDGVASVEDIDTVVRDGLGKRWEFMGPFETADLNTRGGIAAHAKNMGSAYQRMGAERGDFSEWTEDLVEEVVRQRRQQLSLENWESRVAWRDHQMLRRLAIVDSERFDS